MVDGYISTISFYKIHLDDGILFSGSSIERKEKNKVITDKEHRYRNFRIDPSIDKEAYDYIVDDEDRMGNVWENCSKTAAVEIFRLKILISQSPLTL
ncbi:hypothetical protein CEXT_326261 [Caerostris extrusa]|uniref:Uncharacterized protein n=1 Tax=Caerostris extrusa TaxID=172846 RepID=A0AAV4UR00_CAEEX|nr:hypothetical protein CEXT_326261 [Caerostris extrusa]